MSRSGTRSTKHDSIPLRGMTTMTNKSEQRDKRDDCHQETMPWPKTGDRDWAAASPRSSATSARRPRSSSARATRARRRSNSSSPIRAIRAAIFPTPSSTSSRPRSRSAASSSRSWCARCKGATDQFEIVAGERRWRAAQRAGLHDVPIVAIEVTDAEALELAIIENVQRTDLNPLEEAMGYQALIDEYKHSQNDIAQDRRQEPQPCRQHAAAVEAARTR